VSERRNHLEKAEGQDLVKMEGVSFSGERKSGVDRISKKERRGGKRGKLGAPKEVDGPRQTTITS